MRFDSTTSSSFISDNPHRILATTDSVDIELLEGGEQILPLSEEAIAAQAVSEAVARELAKQMIVGWFADSIRGNGYRSPL